MTLLFGENSDRMGRVEVCNGREGRAYGPFDAEQGSDFPPADYVLYVRRRESLLEGLYLVQISIASISESYNGKNAHRHTCRSTTSLRRSAPTYPFTSHLFSNPSRRKERKDKSCQRPEPTPTHLTVHPGHKNSGPSSQSVFPGQST